MFNKNVLLIEFIAAASDKLGLEKPAWAIE